MKGNMSLIQSRHIIWDEIIFDVKNIWDNLTLIVEKKIAIKETQFFILPPKEEDGKNTKTIGKFSRYLNEKSANELRVMDIIDRIGTIF